MSIYDIEMDTITGDRVSLSQFKDKLWLIVNLASR